MEIPYTVTARKDTGLFNAKVGIWLFLASEVMLFGGLFSGYIFLRIYADYPWPERALPVLPGLINTFVLIGSSVTVVFAWASLKMRQWRRFQFFMAITIACAGAFMLLKGIEYNAKWHHQAVRMDDYTIIEGHTHKAQLKDGEMVVEHKNPGHGEAVAHGATKDDDGKQEDAHEGMEFPANRLIFQTTGLTFSLVRTHKAWLDSIMEQAEERHAKLLASDHAFFYGALEDFPTDEAARKAAETKIIEQHKNSKASSHRFGKKSLYVAKGTPLDYGLLKKARGVFIAGRAHNAEARTAMLRDLWDKAQAAKPSASSRELGEEIELEPEALKEIEILVSPTLAFDMQPPIPLVLDRGWIKKKKVPSGATATDLRDDTALRGELQDSPILLAVDAIDFRYVAQKAKEANKDPLKVIEKLWIFSDENEHAAAFLEVWKRHEEHIAKLEKELAPRGREPTDTERYRVTWQDFVEYQTGERPSAIEGFAGPNHKNKNFEKAFLELRIPHEEIFLESKFTPKWNTYYAIYFTLTGLHGLHVVAGALVLSYYLFFSKGLYRRNPEWLANRVEVGGLFWHFVDLVWIFLFPILYLM